MTTIQPAGDNTLLDLLGMDIGPTIGQAVPPAMPQQPMETGLLDLLGDTSLSSTVAESKSCCTV